MREAVKFLNYRFLPDDKIAVEWVRSLPSHVDHFLLIIDAGCEPGDREVRVGILRAAWFEHEAGCVLVLRGDLVVNQRFAVSENPLVSVNRLAA
ncbi:MAG: hypothetical protein M3R14_07210 [Acidobacteriota bacterium]|nr:hypothetical protein [Acidobacteriota bacterium]